MPEQTPPPGSELSKVGVASFPTPGQGLALDARGRVPPNVPVTALDVVTVDPTDPYVGQMWYRSDTSQFCIRHSSSTTKRVALA